MTQRSKRRRRARPRPYVWADDKNPGAGIIMCEGCGEPVRDHKLTEICPSLKGETMTVGKPITRNYRKQQDDA